MKTRKILLFSLSLCIITIFGLKTADGQDIDKTYKWNYKVNTDTWVVLDNYDTDMEIHTWDKPEIEFHMTIQAEFRNQDDASDVDAYLRDLEFKSTAGRTEINSKFWKSRTNIMGFSTMVLEGFNKVRYKKFKMECAIWIPQNASLELNTKYSEINMDDIDGELKLDSYDDELYAGSVGGTASITAKYSEMAFTGMKDIVADLYSCELATGNAGNMKIITKYSDIDSENIGILDIDSYEDDFTIKNCSDIKYIAKYSELTTGQAGKLVADNYECEFAADRITDARIESKYSEFDITTAGTIDITSFYEDNLTAEKIRSLNIEKTKYGDFEIEEIEKKFTVKSAYEDDFSVDRLGMKLEELNINGKYLNIELGVAFNFDCRLKATIKYPEMNIDDNIFKTKIHIKDGSNLEYEGIKGTEKEGMPELVVKGYEVNLKVSEH
ncbi:MAG TPA: hypothetical protein ENH59_11175 [Bacteroidetes bacterium]|nr:hypothetical protein [Bacteroidota bacterium]